MSDEALMHEALALARRGLGRTHPNPLVGALILRGKEVVGRGYHRRAGAAHAEIAALKEAESRAVGGTLYVTLEPCCHVGRTPPCTEAIIASGLRRVIFGTLDPNPRVSGKGARALREAGLEVRGGVLEKECRKLNEDYAKWVTKGLPFVILKAALSLDGKIATRTGSSRWITGREARAFSHGLRASVDAIMVGVETVLKDDPLLTARPPKGPHRSPLRVILDSRLRTPPMAKVLTAKPSAGTILVATEAAPSSRRRRLEKAGAQVWILPGRDGRVSLQVLLRQLAEKGCLSLLVEGGSEVHAALLSEGLADKVLFFIAPLILGGREAPGPVGGHGVEEPSQGVRIERVEVQRLGEDILVEGYISLS